MVSFMYEELGRTNPYSDGELKNMDSEQFSVLYRSLVDDYDAMLKLQEDEAEYSSAQYSTHMGNQWN